MTTQNIGLFQAMGAKMRYLDQRQTVLSQNIANANTPGFKPKDLTEVDFGRVLKKVTDRPQLHPETTHGDHMPSPEQVEDPDKRKQRETYDIAPTGNAVVMEEQIMKSTQNTMDYNLMTTLYQKNVNMFRMALGGQ